MLSDLKKLTDGLIIFSALYSVFEKPDFKYDALAGVRANYFNSHNSPQMDKTEIYLDSDLYGLSYNMNSNSELSWKISRNNRPYQSVKKLTGGMYCVFHYDVNGFISKRIYFDNKHIWLKTEYFDSSHSSKIKAVIYPKIYCDITTICIDKYSNNSVVSTEQLFPSAKPLGKRCPIIIYSNCGMLWYDKYFTPEDLSCESNINAESIGFNFSEDSFIINNNAQFDITNSENLHFVEPDPVEETQSAQEYESKEYTAYDKIEKILLEAHKTNKDLFGEIINHAGEFENKIIQDAEIDLVEEKEAIETSAESTTEQTFDINNEEIVLAEEVTDSIILNEKSEPNSNEEINTIYNNVINEEIPPSKENEVVDDISEDFSENNADVNIVSQKAVSIHNNKYYYYGKVDFIGNRQGEGRTESKDGITLFNGNYCDDLRDGFGVAYYKNGKINYVGDWSNNLRNGSGVGYRLSDGTLHAGKWINNKPNNYGARFDSNGEFIDVCNYKDGVKHGKSISFDKAGNVIISIWDNGEKISEKLIED